MPPSLQPVSFFDETQERMNPVDLRREQEHRLRVLMEVLQRNAFYQAKLEAAGCDPRTIRSLEDLPRLPLTTKGELVAAQRDEPPFGGLNTYPLARYRHFHQTAGTSGQPLRWLDTERDWDTWERCWGHVYCGAGVGENDLVFGATSGSPCEAGQRGEFVITTLGRHGMPVVRYKTGDLVELESEACGCGRVFRRIRGGVLGRADDMFIVRGVNLYPAAVDDVVRAEAEVVEYEVEIRDAEAVSELVVKLECHDDDTFPAIERSLAERFHSRFGIRVEIERAANGSLPRYESKARRYKRVRTSSWT